ncbi:MAG TPA: hypothetical protein VE251_01670 [Xanthobacteraceae bacterium]|nr:hypothetical protein [Xanthobacteraceae bacterium]
MNLLADIDEALDNFARNAKAEIALHARRNDARECPLGGHGRLRDGDLDELGSLTRIELRRPIRLTADCRCRTEDYRGGAEADRCRQSGGGQDYLAGFLCCRSRSGSAHGGLPFAAGQLDTV